MTLKIDSRYESLTKGELGIEGRARVEARLRMLEGGHSYKLSGTGKVSAKFDKHEAKSEISEYKTAADNTMGKKRKFEHDEPAAKIIADNSEEEPKKKKKKKKDKGQTEAEE